MPNVRLRRHYSLIAHGPDTVELRYGVWNPTSVTLTDEARSGHLLGILGRLDGRHSVEEIAAAEGIPVPSVEALLERLDELSVLEQRSSHALDSYLDHVSPTLAIHERNLEEPAKPAVLIGDNALLAEIDRILASRESGEHSRVRPADPALRGLLSERTTSWLVDSLAFEEEAEPFAQWAGQLVVFGVTSVNPLEMRAFNRISLRHRIPWLHAAVDGPFLLIGPTFIPHRSACFECLETRILMTMREGANYQRYKCSLAEGRVSGGGNALDTVLGAMLASLTAFEALNFLETGASFTLGKMLSVFLPTMEFRFNEVLRLPDCPGCGSAPESHDRELYFDIRTLLGPCDEPPLGGFGG